MLAPDDHTTELVIFGLDGRAVELPHHYPHAWKLKAIMISGAMAAAEKTKARTGPC